MSGPEGERVTFGLESVELHHDPETDITTTAPVVVSVEAPNAAANSRGPNLTANQRSMLNVLEEAGRGGLKSGRMVRRNQGNRNWQEPWCNTLRHQEGAQG